MKAPMGRGELAGGDRGRAAAGLAAALAAAGRGRRVTPIDAGAQAGGQFWRQPAGDHGGAAVADLDQRVADPGAAPGGGAQIRAGLDAPPPDHHVWCVDAARRHPGLLVHRAARRWSAGDPSAVTAAPTPVVLATGAHERVLPFPGWALPGVITAGGAQAMLKGGVLAGASAVVGGHGAVPAAGRRRARRGRCARRRRSSRPARARLGVAAGAAVAAVPRARSPKAAGYAADLLRRPASRCRPRHAIVAAAGRRPGRGRDRCAAGPRRRVAPGSERVSRCDTLAVGRGFTAAPRARAADPLGPPSPGPDGGSPCRRRRAAHLRPRVLAAGEVTGVGGAALALAEGAGRAAAAARGGAPRGRSIRGPRARAAAAAAVRRRLGAFAPP